MVRGAVNETDWRDRSRAGVVRWSAVSLALHLVVTQLPDRLEIGAAIEPTNAPTIEEPTIELTKSDAPSVPPVSEIPVELQPAPEAPKASAQRSESMKSAVAKLVESHDPARPQGGAARVPGDRTALTADPGAQAGGATAADAAAPEAGAGGSSSFADLEPSRPGERLMFDPFRANRDRSSGGIRILVDFSRLRHHPLGVDVGELIARVDPSALLGPTGIDPIRDTERLFIRAPSLRDWAELVMMIQHRIPNARLRARLDQRIGSVASSAGDRGDRFFVTPKPGLLIATPESVVPSAEEITSLVALPSSPPPSVVWAHLETPWRVFFGTPVSIPRSLRWAEVLITPDAGGGMTVRVEAEDKDERSAPIEAARLAAAISDGLDLLAGPEVSRERRSERAPSVEFHTRSSIIVGTCRFSAAQVAGLVADIRSRLDERAPPPSTNP